MTAFAAVVDALFADPSIGCEAVYTSDGGAPTLVRIVSRQADAITDFGGARLWSETTRIDLCVAEVANPHPGDRIEIDGDAFLIQGEPVRDRDRLVWAVDLSLKLDITPDFVTAMVEEVKVGGKVVTAAMRVAGTGLKDFSALRSPAQGLGDGSLTRSTTRHSRSRAKALMRPHWSGQTPRSSLVTTTPAR